MNCDCNPLLRAWMEHLRLSAAYRQKTSPTIVAKRRGGKKRKGAYRSMRRAA